MQCRRKLSHRHPGQKWRNDKKSDNITLELPVESVRRDLDERAIALHCRVTVSLPPGVRP